jgi:type III restriction enzyme
MDSSKKYLIHNTNQPLELLPFFDIIESPEKQQEACYFYNRYNPKDGQARFVSYHFEKEAEIFVSSEKIESKLRLLNK